MIFFLFGKKIVGAHPRVSTNTTKFSKKKKKKRKRKIVRCPFGSAVSRYPHLFKKDSIIVQSLLVEVIDRCKKMGSFILLREGGSEQYIIGGSHENGGFFFFPRFFPPSLLPPPPQGLFY